MAITVGWIIVSVQVRTRRVRHGFQRLLTKHYRSKAIDIENYILYYVYMTIKKNHLRCFRD